ncbi:MAG: uracil-DNA glycosylase [Gammaproteobacteria bacterium]
MNTDKLTYLNAMNIQTWQLKSKDTVHAPVIMTETSWESLRTAVMNCTACGLDKSRTQTVFGIGNQNADLMIVGEAPGFHEDQQGEPFVGRAGQLLNGMLEAIGLDRNRVYIANILKCRPPNNRDPLPEEVSLCTAFLEQQIALVKPKLLLALGRIAAQYLLKNKSALTQLRGKIFQYNSIPLISTFHPAYLLRSPADKSKAYQDLQLVLRTLQDLGDQ